MPLLQAEGKRAFYRIAPFDDPYGSGCYRACGSAVLLPVAKDVIEAYMAVDTVEDEIEPYNRL